ncbi:MAG: 50S ribosomal protein L21 [Flavobacteriales bacterium]
MYAIVEIAGLQYKVEQDQKLYVHRLEGNEGDAVTFDKVLLTDNGTVTIGAPVIKGTAVVAKILKHLKGDKVIVFKKKRRKGYQKSNGHRQFLTQIEITSIGAGSVKKETKKTTTKKADPKEIKEQKVVKKPKTVKKTTSKKDDLTKVEGIGPKVAELFIENGIKTFADLAKKSEKDLKAILTPKGGRYASMNPGTWSKQAKLASEGKWDELKKWQDELNGGK